MENNNHKYHLEDEPSIRHYQRWIRYNERQPKDMPDLAYQPKFSVVIPVYNTVTEQLEECFQSVLAQSYENYELILVDDHSSWDNVVPILRKYEANPHVKVIYRETNGHISVATNDGIRMAEGDYIVFMDCDDTIEPDALYWIAEKLNENPKLDFIYTDEDKVTEDGAIRHMPFFKPDWSPDLFLNMNYTNHLSVYRTSIVKEVGGLRSEYNGSQDYDFVLRFMEKSDHSRVGHVTKILYHWRERAESVAYNLGSKNYAVVAAKKAKEDYIRRNQIAARLEEIEPIYQYRFLYDVVGEPMVSIIIPSKDHPEILRQCVESIGRCTDYRNYEIVVVDNGSSEENRAIIETMLQELGATYIYEKEDFNFSHMCNLGASHAKGDYLLFLNDDMEIIQADWLTRMLGQAQQKHTGAVGAKLYYPNSTKIQHTGVSIHVNGPRHSFQELDDKNLYYFGWNRVDNNCIAVTGACLLLDRTKFDEVGGFDEKLPVAYNDVKLCFALLEKGYYNVVRNDVVAYHHESLSRGSDHVDEQKLIRLSNERTGLISEFWELYNKDPYLNENLEGYFGHLSMKYNHDVLEKIDVTGCETGGSVSIDAVEITDKVRILGWSLLAGEEYIEGPERYLVFRDPFGVTYGAKVQPYSRTDVAEHFQNPSYLYAGFECVLRKEDLRVDIMPYQIGLLTIDKEGKRYLNWCRETNVIREMKPRPYALEMCKLPSFAQQNTGEDVCWFLDKCEKQELYHVIQGWVFKRGDNHHHYSKSLILLDENGEAFECEVYPEERVDVACAFPKEHFLYNTGFICYIYHNMIKPNHEYQVILRLKNQFDSKDVRDIRTEGVIKL